MHQANKYMRVQDAIGNVAVLVPEKDFIIHSTQMRDLSNKLKGMEEDLSKLNKKHHEFLEYKRDVQSIITKEVQKARTQQRQEDAKVYAHWRDKCKSLEEQLKQLTLVDYEKAYSLLKESYGNLLSKYADRSRQVIAIKNIVTNDTTQSDCE